MSFSEIWIKIRKSNLIINHMILLNFLWQMNLELHKTLLTKSMFKYKFNTIDLSDGTVKNSDCILLKMIFFNFKDYWICYIVISFYIIYYFFLFFSGIFLKKICFCHPNKKTLLMAITNFSFLTSSVFL